jgi:octaprenyl-diphosphate synthase
MVDDLLDYTEDSTALGKEVGADLKEGKLTLPVIYALKAAGAKDRDLMEKVIKNDKFSVSEFQILTQLLNKYGGITYTQNLAAGYIERAKQALSVFEPSKTKAILMDVADYALARKV